MNKQKLAKLAAKVKAKQQQITLSSPASNSENFYACFHCKFLTALTW